MRNERERLNGSDEIDLIECIREGWRQRLWVVWIAVPIVALGLAYAMLAPPVYEAKLYIQPPSRKDVAQLNYGRGEGTVLAPFSVKDVYAIYLKALQSEAVRDRFFRDFFLPTLTPEEQGDSRDALYAQFGSLLVVAPSSKGAGEGYVLTATLTDPHLAAAWVSRYADMASDNAKAELLSGIHSETAILADNLEQQIKAAQASATNLRADQIAQLREALQVASSIGLERPPIISSTLSTEVSASMDGALTYMRGSKALEAEIANLESRSSDDPFIPKLREKQERLNFLRELKIEPSLIAVYQQDGSVMQPDVPVKPRKVLIVLLAVLLGVGAGLLVAVARGLYLRR